MFHKLCSMDPIYQTRFSSALLTSVFAGLTATILCMAYYLGFKEVTGFPYSAIINVSSLIFGINILFVLVGLVYSFFIKYSRKGEVQFIILFVAVTLVLVFAAMNTHRSDDALLNREFHELLAGLVIIMGVSAFALIPILFHNRKFIDHVL
jgi:hypothetical protein